ncbi:Kinetochore protein Sos7 [Pleurotus pulmonarius]
MSTFKPEDIEALASQFSAASSNLNIAKSVEQFTALEDDSKDPALVASDLAAQTAFLRKLKFAYLEQNAKDKYVKTIVSDIDDAPIVTADDNKALFASNEEAKQRLKAAKESLQHTQKSIKELAPAVEQEYNKAQNLTAHASALSQKILDARLDLIRLRQTHPHPRLTIPLADQQLVDQVTEMQALNDDLEAAQRHMHAVKERIRTSTSAAERLRMERAEAEHAVRKIRERAAADARNERLFVPLYDWYTSSLALHRSVHGLVAAESVSDNALRLQYRITASPPFDLTVALIFEPTTRALASVAVATDPEDALEALGLPENALDEIIGVHVRRNDAHCAVAAIVPRVRGGRE